MAQSDFEHPRAAQDRYVRNEASGENRTIIYVIGAIVILGIVFVAARAFWTEPAAPPPAAVTTETTPPAAQPNTMAPAPAPETTAPAPQMNAPAPAAPDNSATPAPTTGEPAPAQQ